MPDASAHPLRLGLVGFGRLPEVYYVPAFRRIADARIVAVADPLAHRRAAAAQAFDGAAVFASQREMLDRTPLDGVLIATPPSQHLPCIVDALARPNLFVFCEKPFLAPGQLTDAMNAITEMDRARLTINFNRRLWPRYQRIGELVRSGAIGDVSGIDMQFYGDITKYGAITDHRLQDTDGGAIYDLASHFIDLATQIVGVPPSHVRATATSARWRHDHVVIDLTFPSGPAVTIKAAFDATTCERITVHGATGSVDIADPNMGVHVVRGSSSTRSAMRRGIDYTTLARHAVNRATSMLRWTHRQALVNFVATVRAGGTFSPGFNDAMASATALEAVLRSIESGQAEPIVIPVVPVTAGSAA